jgi:hypothetical protein
MDMTLARRIGGWIVMAAGGLLALAGGALMILMTANYVEWPNAGGALGTIALVTLPMIAVGVAITVLGRWLHGDWRTADPLRRALPWLLRVGGGAAALAYGAMLVNVLRLGFGPEDHAAAIKLALASGLGAGAVWWASRAPARPT